MIEGACARSPDSLSFVIQRMEKNEREKIINAFIDSIKMKDYCIAAGASSCSCHKEWNEWTDERLRSTIPLER